jgi:hypothetical protein
MPRSGLKPVYVLSWLVVLLAVVAAGGGLFFPAVYRNNTWITAQLRGNDLVTLAVAVPLLVAALIASRHGGPRAWLLWMGMLGYMLYNYGFYLFGAVFNQHFLLYAGTVACSLVALLLSLPRADAAAIAASFGPRTPVRWIAGYMLFVALFLGLNWGSRAFSFVLTGQLPQDLIDAGLPIAVVYAMDLSVLVPILVLAAILLWQRRPWGYVAAIIIMVKTTAYTLALIFMGIFVDLAGLPGAYDWMPFWSAFTVVSLIASGFLLANLRVAPATPS